LKGKDPFSTLRKVQDAHGKAMKKGKGGFFYYPPFLSFRIFRVRIRESNKDP
jgi:hypothetical protein